MHWIPFAMVRIAAIFISGILLCICFPGWISQSLATVFLTIFTLLYFLVQMVLGQSPSIKIIYGTLGLAAILCAGYLNVLLKNESRQLDHIITVTEKITAYQVKLITPAEEKEKSFKRIARVQSIHTERGWKPSSGKVNLYWPKTELIFNLDYGDLLLIKGQPQRLEPAYNPYEFNFRHFLSYKNIYHQQFVRSGEWQLLNKSSDQGFLFYAHRARNWSVASVRKFISSPREQAIVVALVLGVTDGLDNELQNAYAASGAMHVLAVSGLHVSIIYGMLLLFLRPLGKSVAGQWVIAIISLVLLWAYAFITGLSPSVLRAVAMFSFVAIAKPVGRNTNIYNTLAASAFCLLIYDPYLIMSVGFQLSYLAVFGIVYLQRPLYQLWEAKSALVNWAWQISCVSIAAQIATFALGFLYFHQFPIYFLLSNLFVIPGSFVVLVGGILLLIISPFSWIASWIGIALEWFVRILNEGIFLVERLPLSLINNVYISGWQCLLLFLVILGVLLLIRFKRFQLVLLMLIFVSLFSLLSWHHLLNEVDRPRWTVYRTQGHCAMEWIQNGSSFFLTDSAFMQNKARIKFHIQPSRLVHRVNIVHSVSSLPHRSKELELLKWNGKIFLFLKSKKFNLPKNLVVDYLVVSNNSLTSLKMIGGHINFGELILDSSNSYRYGERLEKEAGELSKSCFSVLKKGAFILKL